MSFRYNPLTRAAKKIYRRFSPVPHSSKTAPVFKNICEAYFVPPEILRVFFLSAIKRLQAERGGSSIGDYLEFGVFNGTSIGAMYTACKELGVTSTRFFGFDAFEGLPPEAEKEDGGVWTSGFYKCTFEQMIGCMKQRGFDPGAFTWVKGWYKDTLAPENMTKYSITDPGIVFVDCDTYGSSKAVLDFIAPLIKKPTIICLDDWKLNDLDVKGMGEYQAFNEFLEKNTHLQAEEISSYNRESKSFLVKPLNDRR